MAREVSGPVWFFTSIYVCCINSHRARAADTPRQLMNKYFIVDGLSSGRAPAPPRRPAWPPPRTRREARARSPPPIRPRPGPVPARPGRPRPRPPAGPASPGLHFITLYNTTYTATRAPRTATGPARALEPEWQRPTRHPPHISGCFQVAGINPDPSQLPMPPRFTFPCTNSVNPDLTTPFASFNFHTRRLLHYTLVRVQQLEQQLSFSVHDFSLQTSQLPLPPSACTDPCEF